MPKFIRYASDLHLEAFSGRDMATLVIDFLPLDERDSESILVLAGDICSQPDRLIEFLYMVEPRFYMVHYLPGNHEYYRFNMDRWDEVIPRRALTALHKTLFVSGKVEEHRYFKEDGRDYVRIISGTLWGDGGKSPAEQWMVSRYLNDFRLIWKFSDPDPNTGFKHDRAYTVPDMIALNQIQRDQIETFLTDRSWKGKTIIATHHMPSYALCHPRFGGDANGGFASDCDLIIDVFKPDVWIHGHTHDTIDTKIGDTRIVCNPRGYRGEWESEFNQYGAKFIEL